MPRFFAAKDKEGLVMPLPFIDNQAGSFKIRKVKQKVYYD